MESLIQQLARLYSYYLLALCGSSNPTVADVLSNEKALDRKNNPEVVKAFTKFLESREKALYQLTHIGETNIQFVLGPEETLIHRRNGHLLLKVEGPALISPTKLGGHWDFDVLTEVTGRKNAVCVGTWEVHNWSIQRTTSEINHLDKIAEFNEEV